ncbi:MAG TPA: PhoX family phosphatase [Rhodocyclaceae bacterium]|nr:PhoX family phosphatase [Rhodocyclaceae bacterium]
MSKQLPPVHLTEDNGDEPMSNHSDNPHFSSIMEKRLSRRQVLAGGLGAAVAGLFATTGAASVAHARAGFLPPAAQGRPPFALNPTLGFAAIPVVRSDTATIPHGYRAQVLIPWGEPINGSAPAYDGMNGNSGADQEQQIGSHHDGMHYFPSADDPNGHGILCVNHEYVDQRVLHVNGPTFVGGQRPTDEVRKEIAAHGVSVIEIKNTNGTWNVVDGQYNRRITAGTPMEIRGPVRGSEHVQTRHSPDGTMARGTINNCAHGYTPWGTYLTCEENWAGYFNNRVKQARADALLNWFEETQPAHFPGSKASFVQGRYYARYYPETNRLLGIFDEILDQKVTNEVYTQIGNTFNDTGRQLLGTLADLLQAAGISKDLSLDLPREFSRYGVRTTGSRYSWETAQSGEDQYVRFDASIKGETSADDYHNEPNTMGWIVEIDPFDPTSTPKKRTALGRFAHEGCVFAPPQQGQPLAFYMGDDAQNEYVYKFVTKARYTRGMKGDVLDEGTLYVARFNDDGTGDWLALDIDDAGFRTAAAMAGVEFKDQADVLVNTRLAADVIGATKMDRPEWGAVHPQTREVYMTMTNNSQRTGEDGSNPIDAANPRGPNPFGHIIRWREQGNRAFATRFEWDLFVLAGPQSDSQIVPEHNGPALDANNIFASPDGLWIDQFGILWIQTDMSGSQQASGPFGENAMLAANPITGEIKRFLAGPFDQEVTGVVSTPDGKNLFVNFQHPGDRSRPGEFTSNWPDSGSVFAHPDAAPILPNPAGPRPRSATIVITRADDGVVGLQ